MAEVLCIVHDDGHVTALSNGPGLDKRLRFDCAVMTRAGITGYRLETRDADEAIAGYVRGLGCAVCHITFPCGCIAEHVAAGYCPHGTARQVARIGRQVRAAMS